MKYVSTRGQAPHLNFEDATLTGLANDGGLYVPEYWPQFSKKQIAGFAGLDYYQLATEIMWPFVEGTMAKDELLGLCQAAWGGFAHQAVTPLVQIDASHWLLELYHGPTLAFKDVALQLLGQLFEKFLARRDTHMTIIGATSGDTGSAAINAVAGRDKIDIFMLHPEGRISDVQRLQMTSVLSPNVHNIAIKGSFDDAQAMVKRMFSDPVLTDKHHIAAVNSINWARLMAQIVYYFAAALQLGAPHRPVAFSVPTGNFGDVFAGYIAAQMGLPIERLVVATNVNDILHRALSQGDYSTGTVTPTAAPSMDIQVSSNFERLLFDLEGRDGTKTKARMADFEASNAMHIDDAMRKKADEIFISQRADADQMAMAMRMASEKSGLIIDPHSAIGFHGAQQLYKNGLDRAIPCVTLATAHPAKFRDAVERATGTRPSLPMRMGDLFARKERYDVLDNDYDMIRDHIAQKAAEQA